MAGSRAQSQFLRIFDDAATYVRWQSYYVGQTVTLDSQSWSYNPFVANGLIGGTSGTDTGVTIEVPATSAAVTAFEAALELNRLCEIKLFEFDSRLSQAAPQAAQLTIGVFVGEVISVSGSFSLFQIRLGSSLAPVGAQAPPRKFTTELIGAPLRL